MRVKPFGPDLGVKAVQSAISTSGPRHYVPLARNWLLAGPKFSEFEVLSRFIERPEVSHKLANELPVERWAVVGGYTPRPVATTLRAALLAHGTFGTVFEADYAAFDAELLSDDSATLSFNPEHVLICVGHHHLFLRADIGASSQRVNDAHLEAMRYLETRWNRLKSKTGATIHQHAMCTPSHSEVARFDHKYAWGRSRFIHGLNDALWERDGKEIFVIGVDDIQQRIGSDSWWSPRWHHVGKLPFDPDRQSNYGILLHSHIAATRGTSRKCLVVDLDNTVWGGVVGDDGVEGLVFGNGSALGEEFLEGCEYMRDLGRTGVILGVVSKNDPGIAETAFRKIQDMPLKLEDFASFRANWQPKSENLWRTVQALNISMDAVVFIDDNAAECEEVARACPEAIVLHLCDGPDGLAKSLSRLRLFERIHFTEEDGHRAASYAAIAQMQRSAEAESDLPGFLAGLTMRSALLPVSQDQIARTAQLFAKTNQFNLTQVKYSEQELEGMLERGEARCFVSSLSDKFAKHGLVSAIVVRKPDGQTAEIANWVMSCRVFNRTLEQFMLSRLCTTLESEGVSELSALLIETEKNHYARNQFDRIGFENSFIDGRRREYRLKLASGRRNWRTYIDVQ